MTKVPLEALVSSVFEASDSGATGDTHKQKQLLTRRKSILLHDLRHTASTLWQSLGIDPKVRQKMLGHSDVDITMTVYSHVLPEMQKQAIEKINGLFEEQ